MNTSAKGNAYEWAYRRAILPKCWFVLRTAASHGPFDLIAAYKNEPELRLIQMTSKRMSCAYAEGIVRRLWMTNGMPMTWFPFVVHRTKREEFCEH